MENNKNNTDIYKIMIAPPGVLLSDYFDLSPRKQKYTDKIYENLTPKEKEVIEIIRTLHELPTIELAKMNDDNFSVAEYIRESLVPGTVLGDEREPMEQH